MKNLGNVTLTVIVFTIAITWGGWMFQTLWAWLLIPTLGVAPLPYIHACALRLFIAYLTPKFPDKSETPYAIRLVSNQITAIVISLIYLLAAFVLKFWL